MAKDPNRCFDLSESKFIIYISEVARLLILSISYLTPIFQVIGILGDSWSILVVLKSDHVCFIKTKYYYASVFFADLAENLLLVSVDKSAFFLTNFDTKFFYTILNLNTRSNFICKYVRYLKLFCYVC